MKKALVIGINSYPLPYQLQGCVNDANDYKALLLSKGFSVAMLTNANATRTKILSALNTLTTGRRSGDNVVLAVSYHGSRVPDTSGDELDGYDECGVSVDMKAILDDEIRMYLGRLPAGVITDVFMDCCYSGTGTRAKCVNVIGCRCVPGKAVKIGKKPKELVIVPDLKHSLMAASGEGQLSAEILAGGVTPRGAFSYYLSQAIRAGGTRASNVEYAAQRIAELGISQVPQLEATETEANQAVFT